MRTPALLKKSLAAGALALLASPLLAGTAHADDTSAPVSGNDLSSAVAAARSGQGMGLLKKAAHAAATRDGASKAGATSVAGSTPSVAREGVAVYVLSPEFVSGRSDVPGTLWYVATDASVRSEHLTVYTAPDAHGAWQAVNVASGDTEARMARLAKGAPLLNEPQVGAWYAVDAGQVRPLNAAAHEVVGAKAVSVASYQQTVAGRYGDKLPGSRYDDRGTAGGYGAPAASAAEEGGSGLILPGVAGVAAASGLALVAGRRRRHRA